MKTSQFMDHLGKIQSYPFGMSESEFTKLYSYLKSQPLTIEQQRTLSDTYRNVVFAVSLGEHKL